MKKQKIYSFLEDESLVEDYFDIRPKFDYGVDKKSFIEHMDTLKNQDVQESTLHKKWVELQRLNTTKDKVATGILKGQLWSPTDINDKEKTIEEINNLKPIIEICEVRDHGGVIKNKPRKGVVLEAGKDYEAPGRTNKQKAYDDWTYLRLLTHTMEFSSGIGRLIKITIYDENTNKVLGLASVASDVISIGVRDDWIGWTKEDKFEKGKLNQTCIASTIAATQPFGYNFLGGKLIASLLCTNDVRDSWEKWYRSKECHEVTCAGPDKCDNSKCCHGPPYCKNSDHELKLVGTTTTSLYGGHSMYQRIPFWKKLGLTAGKILLKPDDVHFEKWSTWLKENHVQEYEHASCGTAGTIKLFRDEWVWEFNDKVRKQATTRDELVDQLAEQKFSVHDNNVVHDLRGKLVHPPSGPKQNVINKIYSHLGMKASDYVHGFKRGVYFAPFYENTREYLRGEIEASELIGLKKLENDIDDVMNWWKPKAIKRYTNLFEQGRIKPEHLYYRKMIEQSWEEVKEEYLSEVGR